MHRDARAFLWDVHECAEAVAEVLCGRMLADFLAERPLRSAVERELAVIGEALNQLTRLDPARAGRIPGRAGAIGLRNVLVHGYAAIDYATVWRVVHDDLPRLHAVVADLLAELDRGGKPTPTPPPSSP